MFLFFSLFSRSFCLRLLLLLSLLHTLSLCCTIPLRPSRSSIHTTVSLSTPSCHPRRPQQSAGTTPFTRTQICSPDTFPLTTTTNTRPIVDENGCDPFSGVCLHEAPPPSSPYFAKWAFTDPVSDSPLNGTYYSGQFQDHAVLQRQPEIAAVYGRAEGL